MDKLQEQFEACKSNIDLSQIPIHAVAGLFKRYLRLLPEAVIPAAYQSTMLNAYGKYNFMRCFVFLPAQRDLAYHRWQRGQSEQGASTHWSLPGIAPWISRFAVLRTGFSAWHQPTLHSQQDDRDEPGNHIRSYVRSLGWHNATFASNGCGCRATPAWFLGHQGASYIAQHGAAAQAINVQTPRTLAARYRTAKYTLESDIRRPDPHPTLNLSVNGMPSLLSGLFVCLPTLNNFAGYWTSTAAVSIAAKPVELIWAKRGGSNDARSRAWMVTRRTGFSQSNQSERLSIKHCYKASDDIVNKRQVQLFNAIFSSATLIQQ